MKKEVAVATALMALMSYMGPVSWAESIEDKKAELDEIQRQMDTNTSQRKESEARISNAVDRLVKDGDRILVDVPNRRLELLVDEAELARRKAAWKRPEPKVKTGYLSRYARLVTSANTGAVLK